MMSAILDGDSVDPEGLRSLLPLMLYQRHIGACLSLVESDTKVDKKPKQLEIWGYGILFVTLISACSLVGVSVLPLMAKEFYQQLLTGLVGLAVGSLAASSLFHLLPQAFKMEANDKGHHEYLVVSLWVLFGIWAFFMIERIIKIIMTRSEESRRVAMSVCASAQAMLCHNEQTGKDGIQDGGNRGITPEKYRVISEGSGGSLTLQPTCDGGSVESSENSSSKSSGEKTSNCGGHQDVQLIYASQQQAIRASFGHRERPVLAAHTHHFEFQQGKDSAIRSVAWMIIFGDGFHNFIDGVSIGAAFSESILTGISISLAVMCEELPHELGDFAVLLNSGMTMRQAVMYNFLSATTCYLGLVVGIILGEFTQNNSAIFALAAGMFLYISLVDMVPEMNEVADKAAQGGLRSSLFVLLLQNIGIALGVGILFFLAYYQESIVIH